MQVTLDKTYPIKAPLDACWGVLSDVAELATCMPGAAITEKLDEKNYKGSVKVKVGPATAAFAGDIEVISIDQATRTLVMMGKGADKGGSSASMHLTATLVAGPDGSTELLGKADVIVNGKFAQFGGRMMTSVSDMILAQFAGNFEIKAIAATSADAAPIASDSGTKNAEGAAEAQAVTELNGLAIAWMLIKDFFGRLFGGKS
ncbi:MAG: SRPBCC family protein [Burkholderiaceae bacterium]|jgi:carbon monoxide dehydrogenase subunit G|nr:SRPBCC family protein [Oxalobacteraceae bacterium]